MHLLRILLTLFAFVFSFTMTVKAQEFEVGQVWRYQTRTHEKNSTATIAKIDHFNGQTIIHLFIESVRVKQSSLPAGYADVIAHLPITAEAFNHSVTELMGTSPELPNIQESYARWLEAYRKGSAGIYTQSIAECLDYMETK